ncbi:type VII secretion-associated serine protease mycosin [Kitasatospora cineracea]|uniref:Type VII secretion-associated serine protease mycosin n=1 Tax=Kitasatospora cineracea TaxID=88074 RepID=A0A8G1UJM0_9ACTN|nr:type VII secretion-associated serine protease mycosin [Kitasatospora cineracea]
MRGLAALAAGALLWGVSAGPAAADQDRQQQWVLNKYGLAKDVWPVSQGDQVIVAVIDSGVDASHPDLAGQVLPGLDLTGGGGDGRVDTEGHGTAMASDIAAHGHGDNAGVMGIAPKAKILPVKFDFSEDLGSVDNVDFGKGIRFAVDHGAKVINMSFYGGNPSDPGYRGAIEYAIQKDVVLVSASGNHAGLPIDYPAGFPGVVVVSGVAQDGSMWPKSTTGPQVTLAGPADGIHRADLKQGYATASGTSEAAAIVSGIAALVRSKYPNLSAGQVINRITKSAFKPEGQGSFPNDKYGYGIASASGALAANPAVDNGPKENPLLNRTEPDYSGGKGSNSSAPSSPASKAPSAGAGNSTAPQASGDADSKKSNSGMLIAVGGGVLALIVIVVIVVLVRRSKNGNNGGGPGGPGGSGGPGAPGGPGGPGYGYQQQMPPQQQPAGYGYPQGQQAPGYPPQQPPAGGNPYQS